MQIKGNNTINPNSLKRFNYHLQGYCFSISKNMVLPLVTHVRNDNLNKLSPASFKRINNKKQFHVITVCGRCGRLNNYSLFSNNLPNNLHPLFSIRKDMNLKR